MSTSMISPKQAKDSAKKAPSFTRYDLTVAVAKSLGTSLDTATPYVEATILTLAKLLKRATPFSRIELRGLGVFEVKPQKERIRVRNPKTGQVIEKAGGMKVHFKTSKVIKTTLEKSIIPSAASLQKPKGNHSEQKHRHL